MPAIERRTPIVQLTRAQIERAIGHVLPDASVTAHRLLDGGRANTNYVVETNRGAYVLRIYVRDAATCGKERALHAFLGDQIPVAKLWGSGDLQGLGQPFSVFDFVPGVTLEELALRGERAPLL